MSDFGPRSLFNILCVTRVTVMILAHIAYSVRTTKEYSLILRSEGYARKNPSVI
jgi:hypothetical protein